MSHFVPSCGSGRAVFRAACVAAALLGALAGCSPGGIGDTGDSDSEGPRLPVVGVQRITPEEIVDTAEILGQLEPVEAVWIRTEIDAVIAKIDFEEGQEVGVGKVLFRLRDGEQRALLQEADAALRLADDVYERTLALHERGSISVAELRSSEAQRDAARARVANARVALRRTVLRSPFDGVVAARKVSIGSSVEPDMDLVEVQKVSELELTFTVPEAAVPLMRIGVPFELSVMAYPDERFPGTISYVAPGLNPRNRRLPIKGRVPNPKRLLRPGFFARGDIEIARFEDALVVPEDAVVFGPRGTYVWRLGDGNVTTAVGVELGIREAGRVQVTSGLASGDTIVVAGTHKVSEGEAVEPDRTETAMEGEAAPARAPGG